MPGPSAPESVSAKDTGTKLGPCFQGSFRLGRHKDQAQSCLSHLVTEMDSDTHSATVLRVQG